MLCATSEVHAKRVQWHAGVLTQPWSHSLGEKKTLFKLTTTLYVLYASCTTCVIDPRFLELKCGGPRGLSSPNLESRTWRSEVQQSEGLSIDSSLAGIDTLHHCNNETEATLCTTSESRCSPSESGSTEGCSSCFGRTRDDWH